MKSCWKSFNIYLLAVSLAWLSGCETLPTAKGKKEATVVHFHVEMNRGFADQSVEAPIFRASPTILNVSRDYFLDQASVTKAEVIESQGAIAIRLEFNRHGKFQLSNISIANRGKRIAVFALFGEARWLGAVQITQPMTEGVLVFTPDATRAEAERICRGLNNLAKEMKKNPDF